ncbi:unnamed protein product, partial [Amoebophrya sp. A25]
PDGISLSQWLRSQVLGGGGGTRRRMLDEDHVAEDIAEGASAGKGDGGGSLSAMGRSLDFGG